MTDAHFNGLAEELKSTGIDCETVHKLILGTNDSSKSISDPRIVKFLKNSDGAITLITLDTELAEYCEVEEIPCIRVQDIVSKHILGGERPNL